MNFVDPKEYAFPGVVRKNRYKTILPSVYNTLQIVKVWKWLMKFVTDDIGMSLNL